MNSVYDKVMAIKLSCNALKKVHWNIGYNRTFFLKLESKLGLYLFALTTPKTYQKNSH